MSIIGSQISCNLTFVQQLLQLLRKARCYCRFVRRIHCDQRILLTKRPMMQNFFPCDDVVIEIILYKHLEISPTLDIATFFTIWSNFDYSSFCDTKINSMKTKYLHGFKIMLVILVSLNLIWKLSSSVCNMIFLLFWFENWICKTHHGKSLFRTNIETFEIIFDTECFF